MHAAPMWGMMLTQFEPSSCSTIMSPEETRSTVALVEHLVRERKLTLLFIEHDMDVVFSISDRIFVLHQGAMIAKGPPKEVARNQDVINAYLGE